MKTQEEISEFAKEIYKEEFEGEPLTDTTVIEAITLGYKKSKEDQAKKNIKISGLLRELFSSINYSSKKYDEIIKELNK
jgi:uncharacterized radical SAM superfamily Fe-S cluster-containing enzyme